MQAGGAVKVEPQGGRGRRAGSRRVGHHRHTQVLRGGGNLEG